MRQSAGVAGRPAFYDRTPLTIQKSGGSTNQPPHAIVNRWTYTVPSGRKFLAATMGAACARNTVATTPLAFQSEVDIYPLAGGSGQAVVAFSEGNTIDAGRVATAGGQSVGVAGDAYKGADVDGSTGGTTDNTEVMTGTEFDA